MEINSNKVSINEIGNGSKKEEKPVPESVQKDNKEPLAYPDAGLMKAYANIKPSKETVSKDEVVDFIHGTGIKFEQRCQQFVEDITDSDGFIKKETFNWLKQGYEDSQNLYLTVSFVKNSKENGKINHKMLQILAPAMKEIKGNSYLVSSLYDIPKYYKDKNGNYNSDLLDILEQRANEVPKSIVRNPDGYAHYFKTKNGEFDINAINHCKEQTALGKQFKEIQTDIGYAKDENGAFSEVCLDVYKELKPENIEQWMIRKVQNIVSTFKPEDVQGKRELIDVVKSMKFDSSLSSVLDNIADVKSNENNKTDIEYDSDSINFVKNLLENSRGRQKVIPSVLKKINLPKSAYTPDNMKILNKMFNVWYSDESDIETLLDAAVYKAGDKKGEFSFENLDKYIDIYTANMNDINTVKMVSGNLSLETDDYALGVITKLYNLGWEKETPWGKSEEKLDRATLSFIFDMCVLGHNGVPKRQAYRPALENIEKLTKMKLPMSSKGAFENFIIAPDFSEIEKLDKIGLDEIGIKTGQYTHGKFKQATEEELFAFKDYMVEYLKDKDSKYIDINLNGNIRDVIEITDKRNSETKITMYDIVKRKPTTEVSEISGLYNIKREQKNFENNLVTKQIFRKEHIGYDNVERLQSQTTEKYDDNGNLLWTEKMSESDISGVFNVTKTYADGRVEELVKAEKLPNGNDLVKKHLTSFDGTKTEYYYEDDVNGNRIMDYRITDPNGKELMKKSVTFEVIDDNHFVSSRNNKKYDIKFNENTIEVTNLSTNEKAEIDVVNFTKSTQNKIIPLLKRIPGDELFMMKTLNLKNLSNDNKVPNAAYSCSSKKDSDDTGEIRISDEYLDDAVLLHEWGHGKDHIEFKEIAEEINRDSRLREIYREEKANFRANFSDAQLSHIAYFGADMHYLGSDNAIQEGIAETNAILSVLPKNDVSSVRAHYWQQYFPRTIAYLSSLLH